MNRRATKRRPAEAGFSRRRFGSRAFMPGWVGGATLRPRFCGTFFALWVAGPPSEDGDFGKRRISEPAGG